MGKRKRGGGGGGQQLEKCDSRSNLKGASYEKIFCLCITADGDDEDQGTEFLGKVSHNIDLPKINIYQGTTAWYRLYMSSDKDSRKEEDEKKALIEIIFPTAELRGSYLAFHHNERHWGGGGGDEPPLPLITHQKTRSGTCCVVVGSTIYRFGGRRRDRKRCSRKLIYFDTNCPEDGWKRGPPTICGRENSAVVALHGTIYVFGGHNPDGGGVWAEYFDTTTLLLGKGEVEWCPLLYDRPPPLGLGNIDDYLFAAVIDDDGGGKYSGMILVGSMEWGAFYLFDVTDEVWWKTFLNLNDYGKFSSEPNVVGSTIYWVNFDSRNLCAYDLVHRTYFSTPVGDFEICQHLKCLKHYNGVVALRHLAGDVFCLIWTEDNVVHCTNIRFCTTDVIDASVLCCHSYEFDHEISLVDCLLMETPSPLVDY